MNLGETCSFPDCSPVKQEQQVYAQQPIYDQPGYQVPDHFGRYPNLVKIESNYAFDASVSTDQAPVVFSHNKLFIKMNSKMTFCMSYREQTRGERLYLRAMILFSKSAEMHLPVTRCKNHRQGSGNGNPNESFAASIIKINNPKAEYLGAEAGETFGDRLSVRIPLESGSFDEDGNITHMVSIEFGCQSSCSSGINRRPTTLVFTLETENCQLLGKGTQEFKVCSCPKRDAEREDKEMKRKSDTKPYPRGKKPKYERPEQMQRPTIKTEPDSESDSNNENGNTNSNVGVVPMSSITVNIPAEMGPAVLDSIFNVIAGQFQKIEHQRAPHMKKPYERCMKEILQMQKDSKRN